MAPVLPHRSRKPGLSLGEPVCVKVDLSSIRVTVPWDADGGLITVPAGLGVARTERIVRAVLLELAVQQPPSGAVCWCGQAVDIPAAA